VTGRSVVGLASCVRLPKADADEALIVPPSALRDLRPGHGLGRSVPRGGCESVSEVMRTRGWSESW